MSIGSGKSASGTPLDKLRRGLSTATALAVAVLLPGTAAAAPQPERGWGMPRDVSLDGHRIDWLIQVTMFFVTVLSSSCASGSCWALHQANEKHPAEYDHGSSAKQVRFAATLSALIFFVVDGNLWVNSTIDVNGAFWNFAAVDKNPRTLRIEVNAHQWAWDFRYAGRDGKFNTADDIVTMNHMRVPVNTPVLLQLAAADVIHSFYLPNFRVKQDAMPGIINRLWFQSKVTGHFITCGCAQHCGTNHYKMKHARSDDRGRLRQVVERGLFSGVRATTPTTRLQLGWMAGMIDRTCNRSIRHPLGLPELHLVEPSTQGHRKRSSGGLLFLLFGGILAMAIRWQWAYRTSRCRSSARWCCRAPGVITPASYQSIFHVHGLYHDFFAHHAADDGAFGQLLHSLMIGRAT